MEHVLTFLLIRFAIIAVGVTVLALVAFTIAVRLKRRGRWEQTRDRVTPYVTRAVDRYVDRRFSGRRR